MRIIGVALLSSTVFLISVQAVAQMDRYNKKLKACYFLWREVANILEYTREPPSEIFYELERTGKYNDLKFVSEVCKLMRDGVPFHIAYPKSVELQKENIKDIYITLLQAGETLGSSNIQAQLERLSFYSNQIGTQLEVAQRQRTEKAKLYHSLGAAGCAFIFIMLI